MKHEIRTDEGIEMTLPEYHDLRLQGLPSWYENPMMLLLLAVVVITTLTILISLGVLR